MILSDICEVYSGYALKDFNDSTKGFPVIKIGNILANGTIDLTSCQYTEEKINKKYYSNNGDIYIALSGATTGKIGVLNSNDRFVVNQRVGIVRKKKNDVPNDFIKYYLLRQTNRIMQEAAGCAQPNISPKQIAQYVIPELDVNEMNQVVEVLNKLEVIILLRTQELCLLNTLIKARFVEMFGSIKEERLLGDISEFVTVGIANSATHAYAESGVPMLRNQNIKENYLDDTDLIYIKPEFAAKYVTKKLKENDIIAMRTGYPGIACLVPPKYEGCQTFTTLIVRLKEDNDPKYVCSYINSDLGKRFIDSGKVGVAQQNFGAKSFAKMPIKIAPRVFQDEYANFIRQIDKSKFVKINLVIYKNTI